MGEDDKTRKLEHRKQTAMVLENRPPSLIDMKDGEEILTRHGDNNLRIYRKELGSLWYIEFTRIS